MADNKKGDTQRLPLPELCPRCGLPVEFGYGYGMGPGLGEYAFCVNCDWCAKNVEHPGECGTFTAAAAAHRRHREKVWLLMLSVGLLVSIGVAVVSLIVEMVK